MPSVLAVRDPFAGVKDTLSSWDKCMAKTYCKWPVIIAIIVGGLIVLSVVLCIARCVCCGAELACCCFKCCTCCCPSGGRQSKHKRMKSDPAPSPYYPSAYSSAPPAPASNQQYRSHDTPAFRPSPFFNPAPTPAAPAKEEPQYARFDAHTKPANEDALPAMPSWNDAKDVHVMEEVVPEKPTDMELDRLDHNGSVTANSSTVAAVPGGARRSPGPGRSPMQRTRTQDSYGFPQPQGYQNDSFVSGAPQRSRNHSPMQNRPYGEQGGYAQQDGYGQQDRYNQRPGYGQQRQNSHDRVSPLEPSASSVYSGPDGYQQYERNSPAPPSYHQQEQQHRRPSPAHSPPPNPYAMNGYSAPQQYQEPADIYQQSNASAGPPRTLTPGYAPSGSTRYEPSTTPGAPAPAAYPGQQTYGSSGNTYPGQQAYQAFNPGQTQGQQTSGVTRKPIDGSWKDV